MVQIFPIFSCKFDLIVVILLKMLYKWRFYCRITIVHYLVSRSFIVYLLACSPNGNNWLSDFHHYFIFMHKRATPFSQLQRFLEKSFRQLRNELRVVLLFTSFAYTAFDFCRSYPSFLYSFIIQQLQKYR